MSDAGDKRHENVYVRLPDGVAVLGSALPLSATVGTAKDNREMNGTSFTSGGWSSVGASLVEV